MKKFLLTALLGMFAVAGFSQIKWDARFGMNFSNQNGYEGDGPSAIPGFTLGVGMDYGFNETWSLQSGLMITSKGSKLSYEDDGDKIEYKTRPVYLELPILAAWKYAINDNMKLVINVGPYLAVGVGGKEKFEYTYSGQTNKGEYKLFKKEDGANEAMMKRFDMGIQYGVGLEISEHYLVNFTGSHGFLNTYNGDSSDPSIKNMNFSIGVGYRF